MLAEWHLTPEYIINNWTDEKFNLMVEKLAERKARLAGVKSNKVSDEELFAKAGNIIKVEKASGD